jgi:hypothetical protein
MQTTRRALALAALAVLVVLVTGSFARASDAVIITFTSGTGDAPGKITVTNASTGSTNSVGLIPKMSAAACAAILADAAPKVGLKTELTGTSVTLYGHGAIVRVDGASITKSDK